ncbi:hypothetical protein [Sporosarcina koreensis]|uniref:Uncharacterized protein n=1 Tax=Sporosarcina koreensis TaxID=334735 RepID=A0ABW0TTP9_9BACL
MALIYFGPFFFGGYYWTERSAIRDSFPNEDGLVVFGKDIENKKVVIWDTGRNKFIKLIENNFWILYRPISVGGIDTETADERMQITWSATHQEGEIYHTLFAAEVLDEDIVKVIVSNEINSEKDLSLKEVEEQSTIFFEMDVENGVAAHYTLIPNYDVGNFKFRGVDAEGNVVSIY